jgi:hypothetical protein
VALKNTFHKKNVPLLALLSHIFVANTASLSFFCSSLLNPNTAIMQRDEVVVRRFQKTIGIRSVVVMGFVNFGSVEFEV